MQHSSEYIEKELTDILRGLAGGAERIRELHPDQLKIIYEKKWFKLFVPKKYGGLELTLIEGLKIEEGLAYADGSTAWTVTLCSGANWFIGFLNAGAREEIFADEFVCLAGSGRPSGIARIVGKNYEVNGYWRYATGAPHATVFTANCILNENETTLMDENGQPRIASFWFKRSEVTIARQWSSTGMIATASESFSVKNLVVSADRLFKIDSSSAVLADPIYHYPFLQFAEATLAVNISGMAMRFLDLCELLFMVKENDQNINKDSVAVLYRKLSMAKEQLQQLRSNFYHSVSETWNDLLQKNLIDEDKLTGVSRSSRKLVHNARRLTEELYPYCGLAAADDSTEINRAWRNIHTASQHSLFNFPVEE